MRSSDPGPLHDYPLGHIAIDKSSRSGQIFRCTLECRLPLSTQDTIELAQYFASFMSTKGFQLMDFDYEAKFEQVWQTSNTFQQLNYWWKLASFRLPDKFKFFVRDPQVFANSLQVQR